MHLSEIPALDILLRRSSRISDLQKLLAQADVSMRVGNFLGVSALAAVALTILAYALSQRSEAAWIAFLIGLVLPYSYASIRRNKRFEKFEELFPQAIDTLARAVRAGHAFTTALEMITGEVAEPVAGEFRQLFEEQKYGMPIRDALLNLTERMPLMGVKSFVTVVMLQRDTGGNLVDILDNLSKRPVRVKGRLMKLRILVADDHEIVRRGLRALLEKHEGWVVCGEASDGRECVERALQLNPDVVIVDIGMPNLNGLDATRQLLQHDPHFKVIVLISTDSDRVIRDALDAGARGSVLKSEAARDLVSAVEALQNKRMFFTPRVKDLILAGFLEKGQTVSRNEPPKLPTLTAREREITQLLAEGNSSKEVASLLNLRTNTVNSTVKTVLFWLLIGVSALLLLEVVKRAPNVQKDQEVNATQFMSDVDQKNIREIEVNGMEVRGKHQNGTQFHTNLPTNYFSPELLKSLHNQGVLIKFRDVNSGSIPLTLLGTWAPLILLGALWFFMIRQMKTGGNKALSFRRARLLSMRQQFKHEVSFTQFMSDVEQNNIHEIEVIAAVDAALMEVGGRRRDFTLFHTTAPTSYFTAELLKSLHEKGILIKFRQ